MQLYSGRDHGSVSKKGLWQDANSGRLHRSKTGLSTTPTSRLQGPKSVCLPVVFNRLTVIVIKTVIFLQLLLLVFMKADVTFPICCLQLWWFLLNYHRGVWHSDHWQQTEQWKNGHTLLHMQFSLTDDSALRPSSDLFWFLSPWRYLYSHNAICHLSDGDSKVKMLTICKQLHTFDTLRWQTVLLTLKMWKISVWRMMEL